MDFLRTGTALCLLLASLACLARGVRADALLEPCTGPDDWLRLVSSEWLKGDLRRMRNKSIEFKSDKLKSQKLKWRDVSEVCMAGVARFVDEDGIVLQGIGQLRGDELVVLTATGEVRLPREELVAILPGRNTEIDRWSLLSSLGIDANVGNTEQAAMNASLELRREAGQTRLDIGYYGSWGAAAGEQNVNKHRIQTRFDLFFTRYFYVALPSATLSSDKFQNIDLRATPGAGVGYQVFDFERFEWEIQAGGAYQRTKYRSVEPGQASSRNDFSVYLVTSVDLDITSDLEFDLYHQSILVTTDFGATTNHTRLKLKYEITDRFNFEITTIHDRVQEPVADATGTTPKAHDLQFIVGISFELR